MNQISGHDFTLLASKDDYARYFNHLITVFRLMLTAFSRQEKEGNSEACVIRAFMEKLLFTIEALRLKSLYDPSHSLKIDLTESGFPNFVEITQLLTDLTVKDQALIQLPSRTILKRQMLDHIMTTHTPPPPDLRWLVGKRDYLKMIDAAKLFLPFTPGELALVLENENSRSYFYTWGCYDFASNRPYIHTLNFDQDKKSDPLTSDTAAYHQFMETIRSEGSRVPPIGILAMAIDDRIESVHPKVLKRIGIGPVYSRLLTNANITSEDKNYQVVCQLLERYGGREEDFVLFFRHETVFSERQEIIEKPIFRAPRVREVFYIPPVDQECASAKASLIHRYMLLPHEVAQHLDECSGLFTRHKKFTYDDQGGVHGS